MMLFEFEARIVVRSVCRRQREFRVPIEHSRTRLIYLSIVNQVNQVRPDSFTILRDSNFGFDTSIQNPKYAHH